MVLSHLDAKLAHPFHIAEPIAATTGTPTGSEMLGANEGLGAWIGCAGTWLEQVRRIQHQVLERGGGRAWSLECRCSDRAGWTLLVRVTQCALEVLGCSHVEATGAVDSSRKFHRVVWKCSNATDGSDPNEGCGLLNRCCWELRINCCWWWPLWVQLMGLVLWNPIGNPQSHLEEHALAMRPVLRVLSVLPTTAVDAAAALDLHS